MKNASHLQSTPKTQHIEERAMWISLSIGIVIVILKISAFVYSGSMAVMSDMLESLVHNLAVLFALYCLFISKRPPDQNHLYGHGKIQFLSAGIEGALVFFAGIVILYKAVLSIWTGYELKEVTAGLVLMIIAGTLNGGLGWYLVHIGKTKNSIIVKANGLHVLSDCYTTIIAMAGAAGAAITGIIYIDTAVAIVGGLYIAYEALKMLREAVGGLMDEADSEVDDKVKEILRQESDLHGWRYHELRHRSEGNRNWIEMHLIFSNETSLKNAHDQASHVEAKIAQALDNPVIITTHLEPESHHHGGISPVSSH